MRGGEAPAMRTMAGALLLASIPSFVWGQILTENAGVISPEAPILRESLSSLWAKHLHELRWNNQLIAGLTPKIEGNLNLPVVYRDVEFRLPGGSHESHDDFGLGDLSLRGKLSLYQADEVMASTRWAVLAETIAPTGDDDENDRGIRVPRRLQLGLGSWGFGGGSAFTVIRDRHRASVEVFYRHRLPHEGVKLGDEVSWNVAYWHRLHPASFDPEKEEELEVRGVVELLSTYRFLDRGAAVGSAEEGLLIWAAPGLQFYPWKNLLFEGSILFPVAQTLRDDAGRREFAALFAVKLLF